MMLQGLTSAGIGNVQDAEHLVRLAADYGFQAVDLNPLQLVQKLGAEGSLSLLRETGIRIGSMALAAEWRGTEEQFRRDLPGLAETAAAAAALGCASCCTYILPSTDWNAAHFMAVATARLRTCARILDAYGIRLGLEYVGPHHLRTRWKNPFIWTMNETLDWIEAIGEPNVGLLLDSYHWHTTGQTAAEIERLDASRIVHVHINDAPQLPVSELLDNDRLYPGEGTIDLAGFLGALSKTGYRGVVSQEVLRPEPPQESPIELVRRSKAGMDRVFAAAGLTIPSVSGIS